MSLPFRLLHTSDWHLGATLDGASREAEHRRFLDWLLGELAARPVDLLVVAGDVFDSAQPSAEALGLYYRFLAGLARLEVAGGGAPPRVVIVGGNHDAPSRLDAPRELLSGLGVTVVGGLSARGEALERCLVPVERDGQVRAVVAAVPFLHEFRLGIRTTGLSRSEINARFEEVFGGLYRELGEAARERWPGVPVVATGHLAASGADRADFHTEIHQVGTLGGLSPAIFGDHYDYVALGHIHRAYRVEESAAWYSGAPVPLDFAEARRPPVVLRVELGAGSEQEEAPAVERVPVPRSRPLLSFTGSPEEVHAALTDLEAEPALEPYLAIELLVERWLPGASQEIHERLAELPAERRPRLVRLFQTRTGGSEGDGAEGSERLLEGRLQDLSPEEVFVRLHQQRRGGEPPEDLLVAFRSLLVEAEPGDGGGGDQTGDEAGDHGEGAAP